MRSRQAYHLHKFCMSLMFGKVDAWPVRVVPLAVNVTQFPTPSAERCSQLGAALGEKVEELYCFYHVPATNTAVGHIVLRSAA